MIPDNVNEWDARQYDGLSLEVSELMIRRLADKLEDHHIAHIEFNLAQTPNRLWPEYPKEVPAAVIGFGPSLKDTWEELKDFKGAIFTTSKAHDFLIDRDIIPDYHVDCDPRQHKLEHIKNCRQDITYLLSSTMYPLVIRYLLDKECDVKLWNYDLEPSGLLLPEGEFGIPTFADASQQAIQIASILGYKKIHLFGVDYSHGSGGEKHAGVHELEYPGEQEFTCHGVPFRSHWEFVKNMMQMPLVLNDNPDIDIYVHGNGLLYSYLKGYYGC